MFIKECFGLDRCFRFDCDYTLVHLKQNKIGLKISYNDNLQQTMLSYTMVQRAGLYAMLQLLRILDNSSLLWAVIKRFYDHRFFLQNW